MSVRGGTGGQPDSRVKVGVSPNLPRAARTAEVVDQTCGESGTESRGPRKTDHHITTCAGVRAPPRQHVGGRRAGMQQHVGGRWVAKPRRRPRDHVPCLRWEARCGRRGAGREAQSCPRLVAPEGTEGLAMSRARDASRRLTARDCGRAEETLPGPEIDAADGKRRDGGQSRGPTVHHHSSLLQRALRTASRGAAEV